MIRLSAPTNKTFLLALILLVAGVLLWLSQADADDSAAIAFWTTVAGGALLVIGSLFRKV